MRRGVMERGAAALLVALAAAGVAGPLFAGQRRSEERGGGETKPFTNVSLALRSFGDEWPSPGREALRPEGLASMPFRLAIPQPRSGDDRRIVPGVSFPASRRYGLFLLKVSLPDPAVFGAAAAAGGGNADGGPPVRNRITELRSRTFLKYNVSNRIFFVGEAQGSRLRMIKLTLARFFGGAEIGAHPSRDYFTSLSEPEAALLRARDRTVRRALAPRLTFPGLSLNLGGISVQAGIHIRVF